MREQTANDPESWTSFFGPGIALRTRGFQLVVEDVSHWNVFLGVLATLIGVSSVGPLLALILDHHAGLYLFALCVAALIPLVALLMAKRKVIVDLLRKKIKRVTNRRLFWTETKVIRVLDVDRAEKKITIGQTGRSMSKVILILYSGEEFDVTMFFDTMNDAFKDTIVDKINHYLHIAQKTLHDRNAEEEDCGSSEFEEETEEAAEADTLPEGATLDEEESAVGRSNEDDDELSLGKGKERSLDGGRHAEDEEEGEKEDTLILV